MFLSFLDSVGVPIVGGVDALLIAVSTVSPTHAYMAAIFAVIGSVRLPDPDGVGAIPLRACIVDRALVIPAHRLGAESLVHDAL